MGGSCSSHTNAEGLTGFFFLQSAMAGALYPLKAEMIRIWAPDVFWKCLVQSLPVQAAQQFPAVVPGKEKPQNVPGTQWPLLPRLHRGLKWHKGHQILVIATCWAGILLCITRVLS